VTSREQSCRRKWFIDFVRWRNKTASKRRVDLSLISKKHFYLGRAARSNDEACGDSLLGIGMQAIAEAVALGEKAGLDRNRLLDCCPRPQWLLQRMWATAKSDENDYSRNFRFG